MRSDFAKLLVLRGRGGAGWKKRAGRSAWRNHDPEALEKRAPMSMGRGSKYFGEYFAPLTRFLGKRVGRRWDDVYSELREHIDGASIVQQHVLIHLRQFVTLHVHTVDGRLCELPDDRPLRQWGQKYFHVDCEGVLRSNPRSH